MTADKKLAHIVLQTRQLPVMRDWYLKVLDAHVVYDNPLRAARASRESGSALNPRRRSRMSGPRPRDR